MNDAEHGETLAGLTHGEKAAVGRVEETLFGASSDPVRLGRYEIEDRIGAGAFGRVYRARDPELDRLVAIKVVSATGGTLERVAAEGRAMAAIDHPAVVKVFDVGSLQGEVFIVMELIEGLSLRAWLEAEHPIGAVIDALSQAGRGLAAAHRAGLVHGDFKPDNVLVASKELSGRPTVKVADFGLARALALESEPTDDPAQTRPGAGTPVYMAPELHDSGAPDASSDQFAYFVTVYEALHGERPFEGGAPLEELASIIEERRRPVRATLPRNIRTAIDRGLATHPRDRHRSMDDALRALLGERRGLRRSAVGMVALGAVATTALILTRGDPIATAAWCSRAGPMIADTFAEAHAQGIHERFVASGLPSAEASYDAWRARTDEYVEEWKQVNAEHCATSEGTQEADRRRVCLAHAQRQLERTVGLLESADASTVARAEEMMLRLPVLQQCGDAPSADPRKSNPDLAAARLFAGAGRYEEALLLAQLAGEKSGLVRPYAIQLQAEIKRKAGDLDAARNLATLAVYDAEASRADLAGAYAALSLALMDADDPARGSEAREWVRRAEVSAQRAGVTEPAYTLARLTVLMRLQFVAGDLDAATKTTQELVALLASEPSSSAAVVVALNNLGAAVNGAGSSLEAEVILRSALALSERALGANHPSVITVAINLVNVLTTTGHYAEATALARRAIAIGERVLGPSSPDVSDVRRNLAIALQLAGHFDEAEREYEVVVAQAEAAHGGDSPAVGEVLVNIADLQSRRNKGDRAVEAVKRARAIFSAKVPDGHPAFAIVYATECLVHRVRGEGELAIERGEAAARVAKSSGLDALEASALLELGDALIDANRPAEATLRRADELAFAGADPVLAARARFALARAVRATSPHEASRLSVSALYRFPAEGDPVLREQMATFARE